MKSESNVLQFRFVFMLVLFSVPVAGVLASPEIPSRANNTNGHSSFAVPVYGALFVDRQTIGISDSHFKSPVLTAAAGWWGWPGIGIEVEFGKSLAEDSLNSLDLEVFSFSAFNLRLESPHVNRFAAYAAFGVSRTNIDSGFSGDVVNRKKNSFRGARGVFGLTYKATRRLSVDAAFTHHEYDDGIAINSFRVGLRYDIAEGRR